jgi:hypothetical protein
MEYAVTAAFLLAVVAGSFAAVILGGYGIAHLIAFALWRCSSAPYRCGLRGAGLCPTDGGLICYGIDQVDPWRRGFRVGGVLG